MAERDTTEEDRLFRENFDLRDEVAELREQLRTEREEADKALRQVEDELQRVCAENANLRSLLAEVNEDASWMRRWPSVQ